MLKFVVAGLLLASGFGAAQDMKEVPKEAPKPAPAAVATSVPAVPDDLTAAALLYRQGQFDAAIQKYRQFLTEKPNSAEAYAGLTRVYLKQKMSNWPTRPFPRASRSRTVQPSRSRWAKFTFVRERSRKPSVSG
jgi:tetratricopeptide (TPR) repeat protein